ncbi:MAG: hypothetical protein HY543_06965 [Deltaproteobacteria bacterium]|nr:hypothetical protein [Deltaproteobacteria bacterium]
MLRAVAPDESLLSSLEPLQILYRLLSSHSALQGQQLEGLIASLFTAELAQRMILSDDTQLNTGWTGEQATWAERMDESAQALREWATGHDIDSAERVSCLQAIEHRYYLAMQRGFYRSAAVLGDILASAGYAGDAKLLAPIALLAEVAETHRRWGIGAAADAAKKLRVSWVKLTGETAPSDADDRRVFLAQLINQLPTDWPLYSDIVRMAHQIDKTGSGPEALAMAHGLYAMQESYRANRSLPSRHVQVPLAAQIAVDLLRQAVIGVSSSLVLRQLTALAALELGEDPDTAPPDDGLRPLAQAPVDFPPTLPDFHHRFRDVLTVIEEFFQPDGDKPSPADQYLLAAGDRNRDKMLAALRPFRRLFGLPRDLDADANPQPWESPTIQDLAFSAVHPLTRGAVVILDRLLQNLVDAAPHA